VHDGLGASTWLDFQVNTAGLIPAGTAVSDAEKRIFFQAGGGLRDSFDAPLKQFSVDPARNKMKPHQWDEDDVCLPVGSTELWVTGKLKSKLPPDDLAPSKAPGKWMLLVTNPMDPSAPRRSWMVRVIDVAEDVDLVIDPNGPVDITRLRWEEDRKTPFELDLTVLEVHANLVPATAGRTLSAVFSTAPAANGADETTVERQGLDTLEDEPGARSVTHLFSLPGTGSERRPPAPTAPLTAPPVDERLVWMSETTGGTDPRVAAPEIRLREIDAGGAPVAGGEWEWTRSLVGVRSAQPGDPVYTLDDGTWSRVSSYRRIGTEVVHRDFADGDGVSVRFGNGEFGRVPAPGTRFEVTYRVGHGSEDNVPAGTLTQCALAIVDSVTNPLPAVNGLSPEPLDDVRHYAPEAYRAVTYRAVRPEDYAAAAETLGWVQRAGASFRWTGSWLTCCVAADPNGAVGLTGTQRD